MAHVVTKVRLRPATVTVALSGTALDSIVAADIVAGGKTIIFTVAGDQWVATLGDDNQITTDFLAAIDSAQSEATGWDAEVRDNLAYTDLIRDNNTQCTLVLPASASYDITATETITATPPASSLLASSSPIVASPTFAVSSNEFLTPDIHSFSSFESGWDGWTNGGGGDPSSVSGGGNVSRSNAQAKIGSYSALANIPAVPGRTEEGGVTMASIFGAAYDEVYIAFWYGFDSLPQTHLKYLRFGPNGGSPNGGGLFYSYWGDWQELSWGADVGGLRCLVGLPIVPGEWHHAEMRYNHNGFDNPRAWFWYDGRPTWHNWPDAPFVYVNATGYNAQWVADGDSYYLDAGGSSPSKHSDLGQVYWMSIANIVNPSDAFNTYIDYVAVSTTRIGAVIP